MNEGRFTVQLVRVAKNEGANGLSSSAEPAAAAEPTVYLQGFAFGPFITCSPEFAFGTDDRHAAEMVAHLVNRMWPELFAGCIFRAVPKNKNGRTP